MTRSAYGMFEGVERTCMLATIDSLAERLSRDLLAASKYNVNGNKSFKPEVFLKACGVR